MEYGFIQRLLTKKILPYWVFQFQELDDDVFQDSSCQEPREHSESPTELSESRTSPKHSFTRNTSSRSSLGKLFHSSQSRSKTSTRPHPHRGQEEHTKRKLSVSIIDDDEQFQLQDFVNKFCRRYRHDRPFIYSHCCMNRDLQGSRDDLRPRPSSSIDPNTLPIPLYLSTEAIMSLVTSPSHSPRGKRYPCFSRVNKSGKACFLKVDKPGNIVF